ncbi:hypothetical protein O1611_g1256 [Lasiodiplodia mahajangana]|uniref:Uncharacterized protein n=1 Tax=Lasiodiplodia mahajangana TaxID=1108764 RepID=A0ACC2JYU2_9PEZI|nr:hypothetical protein O1611_g1256 [Lasiodiplodia mahajangana]
MENAPLETGTIDLFLSGPQTILISLLLGRVAVGNMAGKTTGYLVTPKLSGTETLADEAHDKSSPTTA